MIEQYSIENEFLKVKIKRHGAELCSVVDKRGTEFIWQAGEVWSRNAPNLFPIVGSLLDHEYIYNNKTYALRHHGFARDMQFDMLHQSEHSICLVLQENKDTLTSYPFKFTLLITFRLEGDKLKQIYRVINKSETIMPFSIGAHPAFNAEPISDYEIIFSEMEVVRSNVLDGPYIGQREIEVIKGKQIQLNEHIFNDDALIFQGLRSQFVTLKHKRNGYSIKMDISEFPYLGIWAKPGAPYVCLEPWQGLADFTNHNKRILDKKGVVKLNPASQFESAFTMQFSS